MLTRPNSQKMRLLGILITCLSLFSTSVHSNDSSLEILPFVKQESSPFSSPAFGTQQHLSVTSTSYLIYLPFIRRERSGFSVDPKNRQESLNFYREQYLTSEGVAIDWTGNHAACSPGTTSQNFRQAVLRRINYFRAMAGVPAEITFSEESIRLAQAAALMMSVNRALSHGPPTSWTCYSTDGAQGAGSSNLALGAYSWSAITLYMKDPGAGNYPIGHRRWILYPQTQVMGTGDIPSTQNYPAANALRVFDSHMWEARPATREEFVAWPPPGYVPYQVVFPRWSFSFANANFASASVTMESNGAKVPVSQANVVNGYGENTLVWIPLGLKDGDDWPRPGKDTTYSVTITHVVINSQSRDFKYDVTVFNPTP